MSEGGGATLLGGLLGGTGGEQPDFQGESTTQDLFGTIGRLATVGEGEGSTSGKVGTALLDFVSSGLASVAFPSFAGSGKAAARSAAARRTVNQSPVLSELRNIRQTIGGHTIIEALRNESPTIQGVILEALDAASRVFGGDRGALFNVIFGESARSSLPGNSRQKLDSVRRILNPGANITTRSLPAETRPGLGEESRLPGTLGFHVPPGPGGIPLPRTRAAKILDFLIHNIPGLVQVYLAYLRSIGQAPPEVGHPPGAPGAPGAPAQPTTITIQTAPGGGGGGGRAMPHVDTSNPLGGVGQVLTELIRVAGPAVASALIPSRAARIQPVPRAVLAGGAGAAGELSNVDLEDLFDIPGFDITAQGTSKLTSPFRRTAAGSAAQPHVRVNPSNGRSEWFRPAGKPVLFSKDMGICRKVEKLAKRAHKVTHRRSRKR